MRGRLLSFLLTSLALLAVTACSSPEPMLPTFNGRERAYKARLAEVAFPTSSARVSAAFPPAGSTKLCADPSPVPPGQQPRLVEEYPLDSDFALRLELATPPDTVGLHRPATSTRSLPELKVLRGKRAATLASPTYLVLSATIQRRPRFTK